MQHLKAGHRRRQLAGGRCAAAPAESAPCLPKALPPGTGLWMPCEQQLPGSLCFCRGAQSAISTASAGAALPAGALSSCPHCGTGAGMSQVSQSVPARPALPSISPSALGLRMAPGNQRPDTHQDLTHTNYDTGVIIDSQGFPRQEAEAHQTLFKYESGSHDPRMFSSWKSPAARYSWIPWC